MVAVAAIDRMSRRSRHVIRSRLVHPSGTDDPLHAFGEQTELRTRLDRVGLAWCEDLREVTIPGVVDHHRRPPFGTATGDVPDVDQVVV